MLCPHRLYLLWFLLIVSQVLLLFSLKWVRIHSTALHYRPHFKVCKHFVCLYTRCKWTLQVTFKQKKQKIKWTGQTNIPSQSTLVWTNVMVTSSWHGFHRVLDNTVENLGVLLRNHGFWNSRGCSFDTYHLPKHCCRPSTHLHDDCIQFRLRIFLRFKIQCGLQWFILTSQSTLMSVDVVYGIKFNAHWLNI